MGAGAFLAMMLHVPPTAEVRALRPGWTETTWPFPIDQWGTGKAFICKPAACGVELTVLVRAKIGFCNCKTGVADDEELERVGDNGLFGGRTAALAPGRPIAVAWMKGRSRTYSLANPFARPRSVIAIALNERCDAIVATVVLDSVGPVAMEPAVLEFLGSDPVLDWARVTLGL